MPNSKFRSVLLVLLSAGFISVLVLYFYINADEYLHFLQISPIQLILIFSISLLSPLINGAITTYLFQSLGAEIIYRDGILIAAASTLANQLPVSGGIVLKGVYLKKLYNLSYSKFASAQVALFIFFTSINGLIGITILTYWILSSLKKTFPLLLILFGLMSASILLLWVPLDKLPIIYRVRRWMKQAVEGWTLISKNRNLLMKLMGLQTVLMLLLAFRMWIAFHMVSQEVNLDEVILFSSASTLTQIVSIAPGGLGVREAIVGGVSSAVGFDLGVSVLAVGLDRLISTAAIFLTGGLSSIVLGKRF